MSSENKNDVIQVSIESEYESLQTVLVHQPSFEVDRLTPLNKERLLFEDIPYLSKMKKEHKVFVARLRENGVTVLLLGKLLLDVLQRPDARTQLVTLSCAASSVTSLTSLILDAYSPPELRDILLRGLTSKEFQARTGKRLGPVDGRDDPFLLDPIPNAYFIRDPAAVIGNCLVSCKMFYPPRIRESIIVREIFRNHPRLTGNKIIYGDRDKEDRPFTIEGGDIIVINSKAVAVGSSERTCSDSIALLARRLFEETQVQRVYEISIPSRRVYMHLDTVFTIINEGVVVAYPDVMDEVRAIRRYEPLMIPGNKMIAYPVDENRSFNGILEDEFGKLQVIHTGDNNRRYAAREQQADGTNVLAIAPGVVVTYDRNEHTNNALKKAGVKVLKIAGSELVRGLGGPRCMTMPLQRQIRK